MVIEGATVAVTGGAGFIGSHLVTQLVKRGARVRVLDNLSSGDLENLGAVSGEIEFIEGSITDEDLCARVFAGAAGVFHLAAIASVPLSLSDPLMVHDTNVTGTLSVLNAARGVGVDRVVFASSSSVYGDNTPVPQHTGLVPSPVSPYAVTKLAGEAYLRAFYKSCNLGFVALRYFNVFGPRQRPDSHYAAVIPLFISKLLNGESPVIEGDGEQTRDFIYVKDCANAAIRAMECGAANGMVFNVACGYETTINGLFDTIAGLVGSDREAVYTAPRTGDIRHSRADVGETKSVLGFTPSYTLSQGLAEALPWYREHCGG